MDYPLISCDDHLDLNQLPTDLWTSRLPDHLKDRGPKVEMVDGRAAWMSDGKSLGGWSGAPSTMTGPKPIFTALDRGGIVDQTERRPAVAELRLADMDRDGVYAHVIFGPVTSLDFDDKELRDACYGAYNEWLKEFCSAAPDRLIGVPMLPPEPEAAVAMLQKIVDLGGFKQANLQIAMAQPRLEDERWEPLWTMLEENNIILSFHVTVFPSVSRAFDKYKGSPGATFLHVKMFIEQFMDPFVDLFAWGILERHPGLKIVIAESGIGWLPWVIEELDYRHWRLWEAEEFWNARGGIPHKMKPSELFKRQVYGTFQQSPTAIALHKFYGEDKLLWATDYPHPDSIWPNSRKVLAEFTEGADPALVRKIAYENAAKLYGLDIPARVDAIAAE
ncbi:amidohydrolase family protein [Sphingobium sp. B2D3C]|uniref:amidohydrolase family protein n=1 Tax=Sphingobium sp. B2D3C TaxID=2940581 RepID=UPI00222504A8|nr:amidohydrolase family protein [Sphingobium sp. B2D3C]MCW2399892.1 putative TIM-barrel fold metal-dependent hydrolase [Sphingobium sp. B2D3C]